MDDIARTAFDALKARSLTLALAESCTGGMMASSITAIPGASKVFLCGLVTYSNLSKTALLGVPVEILNAHGAVSRECAAAMAQGARLKGGADIALSITGIAGPDGGSVEKPVGTVFIALASATGTDCHHHVFDSSWDRHIIRSKAAMAAWRHLLNFI